MKANYTAKSYSGEIKSGQVNVKNERELAIQLRSEGFVLTSFNKAEKENGEGIEIKFLDRFFGIPLTHQ